MDLIFLPAPALETLKSAVMVWFGQQRICDAVDIDEAGHRRSCRHTTAWYRDEGAWALCRDHAYNAVVVNAARRRR